MGSEPPKVSSPIPPISPRISSISAPTQRLYILSFGALLQALKVRSLFLRWWYPEYWWQYLLTWAAFDALFILGLSELRIPRLVFRRRTKIMQIFILCLLDIALFRPYDFTFPWKWIRVGSDVEISTREKSVYVEDVINRGGHLLGQHTVRLSPISTARLDPYGDTFCLEAPDNIVLIPVVFNNTRPTHVSYSLTQMGDSGVRTFVNLTSRDLKQIEKSRVDVFRALQKSDTPEDDDIEEDYSESGDPQYQFAYSGGDKKGRLEKTETIQHIKVTRPGVIRLERALDQANAEVRIRPMEVTVVQCPKAEFARRSTEEVIRCAGTAETLDLKVFGVPPLMLKWHREVSGRREHFVVEGIEADHTSRNKIAQEIQIPLTLNLDALGRHSYTLDTLTDGVGNTLELSSSPSSRSLLTNQVITVLRRSAMSFKSCGPGRPANLLIGKETPLLVVANDADVDDGPWDITIKYQPPSDDKKKFKPWKQDIKTPLGKRELTLLARAPGEYSIINVKGRYCSGDVLSPESCRVVEQPLPRADIEWKRIHECSGDTGVSVSLVFQGKPPFKIVYQTRRDREPARELTKIFQGSRGEIILQPERSGSYSYTFLRMSDANYEDIKLDISTINQVVHPLSSADFVRGAYGNGKQVLHSCSGSMVDIDVTLKGTPPWNLEVQVFGPKSTQKIVVPELKQYQEKLRLPIPPVIDEEGGVFQIDLVSVEDAYGCKRELSVPGISVNVKRLKPTAKFYAKDGKRQITVLDGQTARLPLRLTGDAPWTIKYHRADDVEAGTTRVSLATPNEQLSVSELGLYEILEVHDAHCPGTVIENENTYLVEWVPRPTVLLASTTKVTYIPANSTYILPGVCEGTDDYIDLQLRGQPPFTINYNVARDTEYGGIKLIDRPTFSSIQSSTRLQLQTSSAGRVYYEVQTIGDASYPLSGNKHVIPQSKRLHFEQEVFPRPLAYFKGSNRMSYCYNNTLTPRDMQSSDGVIVLHGIPPFLLDLSIKNLASSGVYKETIEISQKEWRLDVPNYAFQTVGPHLVSIDAIRDASNCPQGEIEADRQSQWIDVLETAVIVPLDRREDFCVGEALQFQLEGTPPWRIKYRFDGRVISATAPTSPFRRVADRAGTFTILSIAQEQDLCQTTVPDINLRIRSIPSAKVSHGKNVFQNIREGDQAEIHFELIGEPPFTFTYQRTELTGNVKRGHIPKVLETHTISGVNGKDYSIYSAAEGTWTVTFIQDRYCRFPPIHADKGIENA